MRNGCEPDTRSRLIRLRSESINNTPRDPILMERSSPDSAASSSKTVEELERILQGPRFRLRSEHWADADYLRKCAERFGPLNLFVDRNARNLGWPMSMTWIKLWTDANYEDGLFGGNNVVCGPDIVERVRKALGYPRRNHIQNYILELEANGFLKREDVGKHRVIVLYCPPLDVPLRDKPKRKRRGQNVPAGDKVVPERDNSHLLLRKGELFEENNNTDGSAHDELEKLLLVKLISDAAKIDPLLTEPLIRELVDQHGVDDVAAQLAELDRQKKRGVPIDNPGGWLRRACEKKFKPTAARSSPAAPIDPWIEAERRRWKNATVEEQREWIGRIASPAGRARLEEIKRTAADPVAAAIADPKIAALAMRTIRQDELKPVSEIRR